jgi:hypothetical protein
LAVEEGEFKTDSLSREVIWATGAGGDSKLNVVGGCRKTSVVLDIAPSFGIPWPPVVDEGSCVGPISGPDDDAVWYPGARDHVRGGIRGG